jgi:hypothetical protein
MARVLAVLVLTALTAACDDPTAELQAPRERQILMMMDLDPALDFQPLWLTTFDLERPEGVVAELWAGDSLVSTAVPAFTNDCRDRLTVLLGRPTGHEGRCVAFEYRPEHGRTYELVVQAQDRPTLTAVTTVPGDFQVVGGVVEGDPPGTERLDIVWTRSVPSHRYAVFVMDRSYNRHNVYTGATGLPPGSFGWVVTTRDTAVATHRPPDQVWDGQDGDWVVAVYAIDRGLYEFMTSGSNKGLFPIPPASNVVNGYGFFGSWVRKYVPVDSFPLP